MLFRQLAVALLIMTNQWSFASGCRGWGGVFLLGEGHVILYLVIQLRQHRHPALHPVRLGHIARHIDVEDKIRTMSCGSQDAPPVARLVDRAEVGRRVPYLDRPFGLEPHERSSRE